MMTEGTEQANYIGNNNPFGNTFNPAWRNHPNFSWRNTQNPQNSQNHQMQQAPPPREKKADLESLMAKMAEHTNSFMAETRTALQNQSAQIRSLETQINQLANANNTRQQGTLPSNTVVNPKDHCNAITLHSGTVVEEKVKKPCSTEKAREKEPIVEESTKEEVTETKTAPQRIPYPQRLVNNKLDKQFSRFLDVFRKLHINIPFAEALEQMPSYAKFMKEIISRKRKLEDYETIALTEECSAIIQRKLPQKLKDPGSFTVPCEIGGSVFEKALCDLGASINLMPLSIFRRLGLGEAKPTRVTLQMADRSIKHPRRVIEDVLVKVDKFIFPANFVVLDMDEDRDIPIILGRPFLATGKALIDVQKGELRLRVQDEEVTFNVFKAMKLPEASDDVFRVDILDTVVAEISNIPADTLEACLVDCTEQMCEDNEVRETVAWMDAFEPNKRKYFEELGTGPSRTLPSIQKPPVLELKQLPSHLRYAFLGESSTLPVIISSELSLENEEKLLRVLRKYKEAMGWTLADIKGISSSLCSHRILMEAEHKPSVEHQRRLNPSMKEVVRKEVLKWLDAGVIYPISDSSWVSPVQVVPKKGGMTVVKNDNNELIPTRTVTGWRICMDYRKLNKATRKDHFPLPFIDQMLDRLAGHDYYCFLDGYSGYNQIAIAPEDQEKTTFTCPYGTFAFRRMPFGLCNAPATFQRCMMAIFSDMVERIIEVFMDDFSIFCSSFDHCLNNLSKVLERCVETNLVLN